MLVLLGFGYPLFEIGRPEAQVMVAMFLVGGVAVMWFSERFRLTRLAGVIHIIWVPLLAWLVGRLDAVPSDSGYGLWVRALIVFLGVSVVIGVVDVILYFRGHRAPIGSEQ